MTEPADDATAQAVRDIQAVITDMWALSIGKDVLTDFMLPLANLTDAIERLAYEVNVQNLPGSKEAKTAKELWMRGTRILATRHLGD